MSENELNLPADDPDNPAKALAKLQNKVRASEVRGKIIILPKGTTKFVCKNHRIKTAIELIDSKMRMKENKFVEFVCDCGVIYKVE